MEYRSWVQGTTFCTRMDYLSPFYNEATYVLGVERLLDIEDDIPEKAQVMRVLLMELNRISSHLVCHRDRRHGDRRADRDDHRLPRARAGARPVRADHRAADEPRASSAPAASPRTCRPGALDEIRAFIALMKKRLPEYAALCNANPIFKGRLEDVGHLELDGCLALGHHRPGAARPPATRGTCARPSPTAATRTTTSRCRPGTPATPTVASGSGSTRCGSRSRSSSRPPTGWPALEGAPVMVARQEDRLAEPARHRQRRHGQQPRPHPPHHGRVDGGPDPPLQARDRGLPGPGRPGLRPGRVAARRARRARRLRRRHQARSAPTSATRRSPTCRPPA